MHETPASPPASEPFRPPPPQPVTIAGPAGALEGRVEDPFGAATAASGRRAVGVVCHPHPLHGGTMQNKVVHTAARAMQEAGATTVRFNFRGVGASEGRYDAGAGELEDALAVIAWARARFGQDTLWLAGFSFGAAVALQAAVRGARPARLVTIAPPVGRIITDPIARPDVPWLVVHGDQDELVAVATVRAWVAGYSPPPDLHVVAGGEHFFHGKLVEVRETLVTFFRS